MTDKLLAALREITDEVGPGGRIPPERDLCDRLGASRTAIRSRLQQLEAAGAIERKGAAGTFARNMAPSDVASALRLGLSTSSLGSSDAFQSIRVALEREAAKRAATGEDPISIGYAEAAVMRMERTTNPTELYEADIEFHRRIFHASGDAALIFFSEAISDLLAASVIARRQRMRALSHDTEEMRAAHRGVLDAIHNHDPQAAMAAMDRHFERIDELLTAAAHQPSEKPA